MARLNSDGSPDGTFSTDGRAMIDFGDATPNDANQYVSRLTLRTLTLGFAASSAILAPASSVNLVPSPTAPYHIDPEPCPWVRIPPRAPV